MLPPVAESGGLGRIPSNIYEAAALQMLDQAVRGDARHDVVGMVHALAAVIA
jgi:hypothetical protein